METQLTTYGLNRSDADGLVQDSTEYLVVGMTGKTAIQREDLLEQTEDEGI